MQGRHAEVAWGQKRAPSSSWSWAARAVLSSTLLAISLLGTRASSPAAQAADVQYNSFWRQTTASDFRAWSFNGLAARGAGSTASVQLAPQPQEVLRCAPGDIDGGSARYIAAIGLCAGRDPMRRGTYARGMSYYNGGDFYYGTMTSPVHSLDHPIDHIVASWDASTPAGTWLELHARVQERNGWSRWYSLPVWARDLGAIHRHSVDHQADGDGGINTDTLYTNASHPATAYQISATLFTTTPGVSPSLRLIAVIASRDAPFWPQVTPDRSTWGTDLPVPQRSQMLPQYQSTRYGGGGDAWCSPTSASMVLGYWGRILGRRDLSQGVPVVAAGTYDYTYDGTGNWPFNTAYASSYGLTAFVTRMSSMSQIEQWIKARVPIIISIAFTYGELPGEPVGISPGHLIVVRGFTRTGDVITNDPAAPTDASVRIIFPRAALERTWLEGSHGAAYVIYPPGWHIPTSQVMGSW